MIAWIAWNLFVFVIAPLCFVLLVGAVKENVAHAYYVAKKRRSADTPSGRIGAYLSANPRRSN